jgi:hypothetical protein
MATKAKTPAPIDRPLSRAYLREFTGWSTAYPPGLSDPTSLRVMENVMINRDGSARVRPGLRYLSYGAFGTALTDQVIGTHEAFFLNDGTKAYLFAVREADGSVGFRVMVPGSAAGEVRTLADCEFDVAPPEELNFTAATTYVKYLQIDNKVFALSNAGEPMRLFFVGSDKRAKALASITSPEWSVEDKLKVVQPDADWVTSGLPLGSRRNRLTNPSFETNAEGWDRGQRTAVSRSQTVPAVSGSRVLRLSSKPLRTNLMSKPLHDVAGLGIGGWDPVEGTGAAGVSGSFLQVTGAGAFFHGSPMLGGIDAGTEYRVAFDFNAGSGAAPKCKLRFFAGDKRVGEDTVFALPPAGPRWTSGKVKAPKTATSVRVLVGSSSGGWVAWKNVMLVEAGEDTTLFTGSDGTDYFWTDGVNASASVHHPPADVWIESERVPASPSKKLCGSIYAQAETITRDTQVTLTTFKSGGSVASTDTSAAATPDTTGSPTRFEVGRASTPAKTATASVKLTVKNVPRGENHYVDAAMLESGVDVAGTYFDGDTSDTDTLVYTWGGKEHASGSRQTTYAAITTVPTAEAKTADTLISTGSNPYSFGFFYTFNNEVGESAASQITVVRAQRAWPMWKWESANAAGEPSGTEVDNPNAAADQLVAYVPADCFDAALAQGATGWNLYMLTWSNQDATPVTAIKVGHRELKDTASQGRDGWIRVTPQTATAGDISVLPSEANRYNYSNPSSGGQGLVAADRMVLVNDPNAAAVIRWSSNQQGDYTNFTASKGGGYKTLTSGNLYVPACVKLWQNPQSVDTLTILCMGVDGYSTGYYMAPAQVASQSEATNIMGFEETTATPGTTSPYGVEVFNNALYHPLDDQLMKSSATNYNINHAPQTDAIKNVWGQLADKEWIISCEHDSRLYYIVHNPDGVPLEDGCNGNEIWVLDAGAKAGPWSRWLVQAHSLRKIEFGGRVYMSVVRPDGIYYLDPEVGLDEVVGADGFVATAPIAWKLETNTQGANRAHDAWGHVQQLNLTLGCFQGQMRYGIRSRDIHGKDIDISKVVGDDLPPGELAFDLEDYLLVRRDLREWFFYAESVDGEPSFGQLNYVQYRYTPVTVNAGYEWGSVETFEYGRSAAGSDSNTTNGTPQPMIDTRRP